MSRRRGNTDNPRVCPECGDYVFGSRVLSDGTMKRYCHGEVYILPDGSIAKTLTQDQHDAFLAYARTGENQPFEIRGCKHTWHQSEDEQNGVFPSDEIECIASSARVAGYRRP